MSSCSPTLPADLC